MRWGLQLRNKTPKRRAKAKLREGRSDAVRPNEVWAMDFVHDRLFDGRKIRALTIDRHVHAPVAGDRRAPELPRSRRRGDVGDARAAAEVGLPKTIRVDNGPEFVSKDLDLWAFMRGVTLDFLAAQGSRLIMPTSNRSTASARSECLGTRTGSSALDEGGKSEAWRRAYNPVSEHPSVYAIEVKEALLGEV